MVMAGTDVALIEPDPFTRQGLAQMLADSGFRVWGAYDDVNGLCAAAAGERAPALVLIDGAVFETCSPDTMARLRSRFPDSRAVVRARDVDETQFMQCYEAGVDAYILKAMTGENLVAALTMTLNGERVYPGCLMDRLIKTHWSYAPNAGAKLAADVNLSEREGQILAALVDGLSNKAIANRLEITEPTVKIHLQNLLKKLRVHNRTQAAIWAVKTEAVAWRSQEDAAEAGELSTRRRTACGSPARGGPLPEEAERDGGA